MTITTTTTGRNKPRAPLTITSMNTHTATEPTTSTDSNTLSEVNGGGKVTESEEARKQRLLKEKEERHRKHKESEDRRRTNIRGEYLRLKEMIPSIKNIDGIEKCEGEMLAAFDTEARNQMARRYKLLERAACLEQFITNA